MKFKSLIAATVLAVAAASPAIAAPVTYNLDPTHTMVLASWNHMGFSNPSANFSIDKGTLVYDAAKPSNSRVDVTMPLNLMTSFVKDLDTHLWGKDFFQSDVYPTATFKSTKVQAISKNKLKVTGNLTIKNITKPVTLDVTLNGTGEHPMLKKKAIGFDATTTIKRSDFGVGAFAPAVSDKVKLRITTEATAQ